MTTILAILLAAATAYGIVESGLALAGSNRIVKGVVLTAALLTGLILPWAIVDGVAGLISSSDDNA
jgi:hypothetical protein